MSAPTITDKYYVDLQTNRHIGIFVSSFSLIFISFIIGKWANVWSLFWPGGYKIRAQGDFADAIGEGRTETLTVHRNGANTEFRHMPLNPANNMDEVVIEQTTREYLEQKWYKFHHLHGFASSCLLIAYILSFLAVSIGVIDDNSKVHTRIFVAIVVFKKIPQVMTTLLCSFRNDEVRSGVRTIMRHEADLLNRKQKIGAFIFFILFLVTTGLSVFEIYAFWSCHAENNWESRKYNESECVKLSHAAEITNAIITASTAIIIDVLFSLNIGNAGIGNAATGAFGKSRLVILNTAVAVLLIIVEVINIFVPSFVSGYYAEVFYVAFLQYTTYMLSFARD